jgi:hypothetical protein
MSDSSHRVRVLEIAEEATLAFEAYGVRVAVSANDPALLAPVQEILPPGSRRCDRDTVGHRFRVHAKDDGRFDVQVEDNFLTWDASLEFAMMMLDSHLKEVVALHAPDLIFVHAGAVAHNGRCLLVPGSSFAGKTTMVAALVRAGATYYSDDFAPLDADGRVHPYSEPLSIRAPRLGPTRHDVESLGGRAGQQPLPIGAIVVTRYVPAAEWRPRRLSPGEAALAVLSHTVPAQERPEESLASIRRAVEGAVVLEGERDEADQLASSLLALLDRQPAASA